MSGYIPAPGIATQLTLDGSTYDSGKIQLVGESGVNYLRVPGNPTQYIASGQIGDALSPPGLFIPGLLVAINPLATLRQINSTGRATLEMVEANLGTAPTGASAANNFAIQVAGTSSVNPGSLTLALDGSQGTHYVSDLRYGAANAYVSCVNGGGSLTGYAWFQFFTPTTAMVISGIAVANYVSDTQDGSGFDHEFVITDSIGNIIATSGIVTGSLGKEFHLDTPTQIQASLTQNVMYGIGLRFFQSPRTDNPANLYALGGQTVSVAPTGTRINSPTVGGNVAWTATTLGAEFTQYATWANPRASNSPIWQLYGASAAVSIGGDMTVAIIQNGTGGTTAPQNVNLRLGWALG